MRVLIADNHKVERRLLHRFLQTWGYEVESVRDGNQAWNILQQEDAPPLAILDWRIPGMDCAEICRAVRQCPGADYTYILLLTSRSHKREVWEGLQAGADDFLIKPFEFDELRARLRTGQRIVERLEALLRSREQLQYDASHDGLTGMWNRAAILEILQGELARSRRENVSVGVLLLDVDHFKEVNDRHGHLAGDRVLREVAQRLRDSSRRYDSIGRYGGEEFLIVLPNTNMMNARSQADRLRRAVSDSLIETSAVGLPVSVSIGLAVGDCEGPTSRETLLRAADVALYRAKRLGRDRVEVAWENPVRKDCPPACSTVVSSLASRSG